MRLRVPSEAISLNSTYEALCLVNDTVPELVGSKESLLLSVLVYKRVLWGRGYYKKLFALAIKGIVKFALKSYISFRCSYSVTVVSAAVRGKAHGNSEAWMPYDKAVVSFLVPNKCTRTLVSSAYYGAGRVFYIFNRKVLFFG